MPLCDDGYVQYATSENGFIKIFNELKKVLLIKKVSYLSKFENN